MPDLSSRSTLPEKMDDPSVSRQDLEKALNELEKVNIYLGGYGVITNALNNISIKENSTLVDIGCGGGDVLRKVSLWAKRKRIRMHLTGIDFNLQTVEFAAKKSLGYSDIKYKALNAWKLKEENESVNIVISNLFCHHFDDAELIKLVRLMYDVSTDHVIINDLHRHWFAYKAIKFVTSLFSGSYLVKYDGPLSVARALTKKEWIAILDKARLNNYSIKWMWAWRWQIIVSRNK